MKRRRLTRDERRTMELEAYSRAANPIGSLTNWPIIIAEFAARGIPVDDIRPRENVLTYHAWRAVGRQVRRGEHGVKVTTFIPVEHGSRDGAPKSELTAEQSDKLRKRSSRPATAVVFHVSQTDPILDCAETRAGLPMGHSAMAACAASGQ